jgi:antagonist of KipI
LSAIRILSPGFLTTVQDLGRPGHAATGVSASGAADALALRIGNRLVGNVDGAAALEMTLTSASIQFETDGVFALAGAEADARLGDRLIAPWESVAVRAGETLVGAALRGGARSYLCVRGGLAVPLVFGSASTQLLTGLGGHEGRPLRSGDRLPIGTATASPPRTGRIDPTAIPGYRRGQPFRVTEGPQASWFTPGARTSLQESVWHVSPACDRMGIRLTGPALARSTPGELLTEGVSLGAIQVPPEGLPIVLFVELQTTGGYPKIANVISADLARLGGLGPGDALRFDVVSRETARAALRSQEEALDDLVA